MPGRGRGVREVGPEPAGQAGVGVRVCLLMAYFALPFDLIPDFIPVLGYADDAIVAVAVLRSVVRAVGLEPLRGHWSGTPDGFTALCRLAGLPSPPASPRRPSPITPASPLAQVLTSGSGGCCADPPARV